jgi:hypothetical protein
MIIVKWKRVNSEIPVLSSYSEEKLIITNYNPYEILDIDSLCIPLVDLRPLIDIIHRKYMIGSRYDVDKSNILKKLCMKRNYPHDGIYDLDTAVSDAVKDGFRFTRSTGVRDAWFTYDQLKLAWSQWGIVPDELIEKIMKMADIHITKIVMELQYVFIDKTAIWRPEVKKISISPE